MRRKSPALAALALAFGAALPLGAQSSYQQKTPLDPANLDRTANACVDFYQFANGGWVRSNPLPAAYARWGSFEELGETNQAKLTQILQTAATSTTSKSRNHELLGTYYSNCMDSAATDRAGAKPIQDVLKEVADIDDKEDIVEEVAELQRKGVSVLFGFGSTQDAKNSASVIGGAFQGGLGLPDRDYYFKNDPASQEIRKNYVAHIERMLTLGGTPAAQAATDAQRVMAFETALAAAARTRVERRNPELNYNYRTAAQLKTMTPNWNWDEYFEHLGNKNIPAVDVQNPKFFTTVDSLLAKAPLSDWKAYLRWKVIKDAAPILSSAFVNE